MEQVKGLQVIEADEIKDCSCQMEKNFAFISYAHEDKIVHCVFKKLYDQGWNLWIDRAAILHNNKSWVDAAIDALFEDKCKCILFFRSEASLISDPICRELSTIRDADREERIATIDIFRESTNTKEYGKSLAKKNKEEYKLFRNICEYVNPDCNAIRLREDAGNDIDRLVDKISRELEKAGVCRRTKETPVAAEVPEGTKTAADSAMRTIESSAELKRLFESDECRDENLKKSIRDNTVQIRISASDITFREEYTKYNVWLFSFDKSEPDADKWDFYILRKGEMGADASARTCLDATDLNRSVPIRNSIRKKHLENARKVHLAELLSGKWAECFKEK